MFCSWFAPVVGSGWNVGVGGTVSLPIGVEQLGNRRGSSESTKGVAMFDMFTFDVPDGLAGLGRPPVENLYSPAELDDRLLLLAMFEGRQETFLPLGLFFSEETFSRVINVNKARHPKVDYDTIHNHIFFPEEGTDEFYAFTPGFTAQNIFDARLARHGVIGFLEMVGHNFVAETETARPLKKVSNAVFPDYINNFWDHTELCNRAADETFLLAEGIKNGELCPAYSIAGAMILDFTLNAHEDHLASNDLEVPYTPLNEILLENFDFQLFYDINLGEPETEMPVNDRGERLPSPENWFEPYPTRLH